MIKSSRMSLSKKNWSIVFLLLILALATFFRFWQIDSIPPGLYPDEAINGNDALETLETGQFKVFYPENNGREGLFIWLIVLSFKLLGPAAWSIRLVSAILGILTVLGIYLLARELFNKKIALLSSFFLAISFWHINFSRIGFRAILVPFLLCFSFYFLFRAFRKNSLVNYIWAGIFFGLGFYTYIAFRFAVLILGLVLLIKIIVYWRANKPAKITWPWLFKKVYLRDGWWKVDIFLLTIIIIALPIGLYFLNSPQDFLGRAGNVSVFSIEQPLKELAISTIKTLGMFNFMGDWNWRHNLAGSPILIWSIGILFIIGFVLVLVNVFGAKKHMPKLSSIFLLGWFAFMLLPAIFTFESIPHALRTIGLIPVVYILAALGLVWLFNHFHKVNKKIALLILILFLLQPAIVNFNKYFYQWAKNEHVAGAFRQDLVDLTYYLNSQPDWAGQSYIIVNEPGVAVPFPDGLSMPAQTIIFQTKINYPEPKIKFLMPDKNSQVKIEQPALVIPLKYDEEIFKQLEQQWPRGTTKKINGFDAYEIK